MPKRRGHYCWACGRMRPNEKFSGRGHRDHICKECYAARQRRRRAERTGAPPEAPAGRTGQPPGAVATRDPKPFWLGVLDPAPSDDEPTMDDLTAALEDVEDVTRGEVPPLAGAQSARRGVRPFGGGSETQPGSS